MSTADRGERRPLDTTLLIFGIVCIAAVLTWLVPAGGFERNVMIAEGVGERQVVVPGTFEYLEEASPQGPLDVLRAPIRGIIAVADIIAFVLIVGGAFAVLAETGAIDEGLRRLIRLAERSPGLDGLLIPAFMILFALAGSIFGMAEEALPFVLIFVPMARKLGYDTITGVAIVMVGSQVGFAAAFLNPFTVGIAQGIAGVPLFSGIGLRIAMWTIFVGISIAFVMRYAAAVRRDPTTGALYGIEPSLVEAGVESSADGSDAAHEQGTADMARGRPGGVLLTFGAGMALLVWGVLTHGWYIEEISALFLGMALAFALVGRLPGSMASGAFMRGVRDLAGTAFIIGLARGILVVLEDGMIIDTVLHGLATAMDGFGPVLSAQAMLVMQSALNFFVPSGSGQAALTMPLMSQFADLVEISRQTAVLAYQLGDGVTNLLIPTNPVLVGALGLVGVPWSRWARWILALIVMLTGASAVMVGVAVLIGYS